MKWICTTVLALVVLSMSADSASARCHHGRKGCNKGKIVKKERHHHRRIHRHR